VKHANNPCDNLELVLGDIQPRIEGINHCSPYFFTGGRSDVGVWFQKNLEKRRPDEIISVQVRREMAYRFIVI
jgi:hypothetical protein